MKSISKPAKLILVLVLGLGILLPAAVVKAAPVIPLRVNPGTSQLFIGKLLSNTGLLNTTKPAAATDSEGSGDSQGESVITGTVTSVMTDTWMIGSTVVKINGDTEIKEGLGVGSMVKVKGERLADGSILAEEIRAFTPKPPQENDLNEDQNDNEQGDAEDQAQVTQQENGDNEDHQGQQPATTHKPGESGGGDHEGEGGGGGGGGDNGGGGGGGD